MSGDWRPVESYADECARLHREFEAARVAAHAAIEAQFAEILRAAKATEVPAAAQVLFLQGHTRSLARAHTLLDNVFDIKLAESERVLASIERRGGAELH